MDGEAGFYAIPMNYQEKLLVKEKQAKAFAGFFKKHEKKEEKPAEVEEKAGFGIPFQVRSDQFLMTFVQ